MYKVLYLDDDAMSRRILSLLLMRKLGYTDVTVFEDSDGFEEKMKTLPYQPEVIFLDIHMQPYDGFHVLKTLRANNLFPQAKIVALTASVMNEEVEILRQAGFDAVIGKPINIDIFPTLL